MFTTQLVALEECEQAIQLRAFLSEMGMPTISSIFAISKIGNSLDEAGASQEAASSRESVNFWMN
ncbi:hypothetical protein A6769_28545 [Nostoc punctiforme NIES-2108]|uniref:Uncharacterized protein n=1 Tax=Nostoc punctiforme NIES-2108 TaxID=1356359 RepID=A0A367R8Z2_NOSPU|nr:hypothetical protein A6769_28545 [Nostoc punctiforme NIES-2108]